ncbi:MAG: hypothetical protein US96_C0003G0005 [Candidatus Woesebacteria bacterium GW2011_GWB1_38_5b]|uniref:DUF5666 domain-containing protein n=1 Tax=Candidatus Woesebacteria bacterium GW2011_GWB1_38_5b TaxID=1618569 RepID=A0A0G0KAH0_9BACT|nr:MAG: hypothetical protein US96_C0003G0005 [Candidatus Woesebacteria bacterium GW2011_GWB1_38_5b]
MRKEVFIAVILGAILGLIVAFGVWRANNALRVVNNTNQPVNNKLQTPSPTPKSNASFSIARPQNYEVVVESPVTVTGLTKPNSLVAIYADTKDYLSYSSQAGEFNIEVGLIGGINNLLISSEEAIAPLILVYTTALSLDQASASPTPASLDPVRQKLQEKLDQVSNKPNSYVGTVTDKTEGGIQIKNGSAEIKQITITEATSFVHIDGTSKEVKFSDLGIGDYIAAVGYKDTNNLLSAMRVIITTQAEVSKRKILFGKVTSFSKAQLEVIAGTQKYLIPSNKTLKIYSVDKENSQKAVAFSTIKEGDSIVALGTLEADKLTPKTIYLLN